MARRLVAGIDVGAVTTKIVVLDGSGQSFSSVAPTGHDIKEAIARVTRHALEEARCSMEDLAYVVSTGYGRASVGFANKATTEIICHARGVHSLIPESRTVVDIGGQDSKVISVGSKGNITNFVMNDKCAAGTGRFLEVMAQALDLKLEELGATSLLSHHPCQISNTCTVFAETEVISQRATGESREDLVAGIHRAIVKRVISSASRIGFSPEVVLTGGVAKNEGIRKCFEHELGRGVVVPREPQMTGALGASLIARDELGKLGGV